MGEEFLGKKRNGKVTLKMIAERVGLSVGTVDRAVNHRDGISDESRRRVLQLADEMGYEQSKASKARIPKDIKIGIAYPQVSRDFYTIVDAGVDNAAAELQRFGVTVQKILYEIPDDAYQRLSAINPQEYDGLAVISAGPAIHGIIDAFTRAGTSVITFNTDAPGSSRLFYIGVDAWQSGMMGAEMLGILTGGAGRIAVLGDFTRSASYIERFGGFCDFMRRAFPQITIHPCVGTNTPDTAVAPLLEILGLMPDIRGIFCTGHTGTKAAIETVRQLSRKDITLVGYDVTAPTAEALREGWCNALIFQDPYRQAYQAVHLLAQYILEGTVPERHQTHIENRIIFRSNIDAYSNPNAQY